MNYQVKDIKMKSDSDATYCEYCCKNASSGKTKADNRVIL
jgi:hypothetical protein